MLAYDSRSGALLIHNTECQTVWYSLGILGTANSFDARYFMACDWISDTPQISESSQLYIFEMYLAIFYKLQFIIDVLFLPRYTTVWQISHPSVCTQFVVHFSVFICLIHSIFSLTLNELQWLETAQTHCHPIREYTSSCWLLIPPSISCKHINPSHVGMWRPALKYLDF